MQIDQNRCNIRAAFLRYFQRSKVDVFVGRAINNDCMSILRKKRQKSHKVQS